MAEEAKNKCKKRKRKIFLHKLTREGRGDKLYRNYNKHSIYWQNKLTITKETAETTEMTKQNGNDREDINGR